MTGLTCIGIFDSGVGGLSLVPSLRAALPGAALLYVADTAYCPYGSRPLDEVLARTDHLSEFLIAQGACTVVVGCNTATTLAMPHLRDTYAVPFVGVEPGIKPAAAATASGVVGILATERTIANPLYRETRQQWASHVRVIETVGEGLVEQVEAGELDSPATHALLESFLEPMLASGADQIALGCTHYLLLMPAVERILAGRAAVIDPRQAVTRQAVRQVSANGTPPRPDLTPGLTVYTTGPAGALAGIAETLGLEGCDRPLPLP